MPPSRRASSVKLCCSLAPPAPSRDFETGIGWRFAPEQASPELRWTGNKHRRAKQILFRWRPRVGGCPRHIQRAAILILVWSFDLSLHGRLGELARGSQFVIPIPNQRRPPFRIKAPDRPANAFAFEILDDRRAIGGVVAIAPPGGLGGWRRAVGARRPREAAEFRGDDRILFSGETEIFLPLRFPRLRPLEPKWEED